MEEGQQSQPRVQHAFRCHGRCCLQVHPLLLMLTAGQLCGGHLPAVACWQVLLSRQLAACPGFAHQGIPKAVRHHRCWCWRCLAACHQLQGRQQLAGRYWPVLLLPLLLCPLLLGAGIVQACPHSLHALDQVRP